MKSFVQPWALWVFWLATMASFSSCSIGVGQEKGGKDARSGSELPFIGEEPAENPETSILKAYLANDEAWRTGDVLVNTRFFFNTVRPRDDGSLRGILVQRESWQRNVFDYSQDRYAAWSRTEEYVLDYDHPVNGKPRETRTFRWNAASYDYRSRQLVTVRSDQPWYRKERTPEIGSRVLRMSRMQDFRLVAIRESASFGHPPSSEFKDGALILRVFAIGKTLDKSTTTEDGNIQLVYKHVRNGPKEKWPATHYYKLEIDPVSLMPVKGSRHGFLLDSGTKVHGSRIELGWADRGEIYVPRKIVMDQMTSYWVNRDEYSSKGRIEMNLHWFRFNEPLPGELLDGTWMDSKEEVLAMVDPEKTGATSLIPPKNAPAKVPPGTDTGNGADSKSDSQSRRRD